MFKLSIVDDEQLFRQYLKTVVDWEELGFSLCFEARDGEDALEKFKEEVPDLALIDITMPFMNGIQLAENIKKLYPSTYIIFVTGHGEFEYARKAIKLGVKDYILKPFTKEEIIRTINEVKKLLNENKITKLFSHIQEGFAYDAFYDTSFYDEIYTNLKLQNKDKIKVLLDKIFQDMREKNFLPELIYGISKALINTLNRFLDKFGGAKEALFNSNFDVSARLQEMESIEELIAYIENLYMVAFEYFKKTNVSKGKKIVSKAKDYIDESYHFEDLRLDKICRQVYVNESYLRLLFKKELGVTISDYISSLRMDKAKELIDKGGMRFSDIGEAVGISDAAYFSKCFKRYFGMSPKEYEASLK